MFYYFLWKKNHAEQNCNSQIWANSSHKILRNYNGICKSFSYLLKDLVIFSILWVLIFNQAEQFNKFSWKNKQNNTENFSSKMLTVCKWCWQLNNFSFEMTNTCNSLLHSWADIIGWLLKYVCPIQANIFHFLV